MIENTVTYPNTIHGFQVNGMIDKEYKMFPDFEKLLVTCQSDPTKEEYNLCIDSFPDFYTKMLDNGHLDDFIFKEVRFPMDTNASG